jgi:hypothetical protein
MKKVNRSKGNHYPSDVILRLLLVQVNTCRRKLAYLVVRMAGSSLKSAKMKQVT